MKVLVTGGTGFIGSAIVRHIIRTTDAEVVNVDKLTYAATPEAIENCVGSPRYSFIQADICNAERLRSVFEEHAPGAVLHLAAESHVDRSIDGPDDFIATNVVGTFALLQAALSHFERLKGAERESFRFHHVSTDEVFGSLTFSDTPFTETSPYRPNSPYSASKAAADHLVRAWGETYGLPILWSNCSNNYGPWQFPEKLIPVVISKAFSGEPLPVYGMGENVRDWLHVEDHASALWTILTRARPGARYNVGGNAERSNIEVVEAICARMDARYPQRAPHRDLIHFVPDRPGHDLRYAIDASRLEKELDFKPAYSFERGLAETVDWYLENKDWWQNLMSKGAVGKRLGLSGTDRAAGGSEQP